uniref:PDZ domain-containing protein n=1 Tax=Macrostomum lignano TaxID=282301 RepID=A0A1I8F3C6_9PLAT
LNTEWTELEVIDLLNDGSGLGFGIQEHRRGGPHHPPGGAADRDGRLCSGDHILSVGTVCTRGMASEHVASLLRQCSDQLNDEEAMAEAEQQDSRREDFENEEEKHFTVLLNRHGSRGLGITIAGYVGECPSGQWFESGRLLNHAAVELLRSCGSRVRLRLVRYKSGHVHHQLMAHTLSTPPPLDACGGATPRFNLDPGLRLQLPQF